MFSGREFVGTMSTIVLVPFSEKSERVALFYLRRSLVPVLLDHIEEFSWLSATESDRLRIAEEFDTKISAVPEAFLCCFPLETAPSYFERSYLASLTTISSDLFEWTNEDPIYGTDSNGKFKIVVSGQTIECSVRKVDADDRVRIQFNLAPYATIEPDDVVSQLLAPMRMWHVEDGNRVFYYGKDDEKIFDEHWRSLRRRERLTRIRNLIRPLVPTWCRFHSAQEQATEPPRRP
jgi:hypothetical protein